MNLIRAVTLTVPNAAVAAARYMEWFDYRLIEQGRVDAALAQSWSAPASAGRSFAIVRPCSGSRVDVRFVEGDPVADYRPLRSHGWAAIEICIQNVATVHAKMQTGPFEIIGPPSAISSLPTIHPMQVRSPDGEIIYLTEIKQSGPTSGLPYVHAPIDKVFICVLACADMAASAQWFAAQLGIHSANEMSIPYRMLNQAFDLPAGQLHRLTTADHDGDIFLEFDEYPAAAVTRPKNPGQLPPGVALCTLSHPDIDTIPGPWLTPPRPRKGVIYEGRRVGMLQSPEGALLEVVEMEQT
jgi:hypothetical protein